MSDALLDTAKWSDPWWRLSHLYTIVTDEGQEVPFVPNEEQRLLYSRLHNRNLVLKARQLGFCLDPDTLVLTADLRWVRIGDLQPGQEVVAVDENPPGGRGKARKMRTAVVQASGRVRRPAFRITFDDGRHVVCTAQHPASPLSATVGTSGAAGEHCALVTANAFNLPAFTCGMADSMVSNIRSAWSPITSVRAGALPL